MEPGAECMAHESCLERVSASAPRAQPGLDGRMDGVGREGWRGTSISSFHPLHSLSPGALPFISISEGASLDVSLWPGQQR